MKPTLLIYLLLNIIFFGCKKNKEESIPATTFSYTIFPQGLIRFTPSNALGKQEWDFGDHSEIQTGISGQDIYHYYAFEGRYTIRLKTTSGLGGVTDYSLDVETGAIPSKGLVVGITLNNFSDTIPDPDYTKSDVYFKINHYAENSSTNLYTSSVTFNCDTSLLPLHADLSGANKVEFPLQSFLVSVSALDDNSDNGNPDDELCYLGWDDYAYRPQATGYTFIEDSEKPNFYPEEITNSKMSVQFNWE